MNLSARITAIKAAWTAAIPAIPLNLHLSAQKDTIPSAVLIVTGIDQFQSTTTKTGWRASMQFKVDVSSDTEALSVLDSIVATFNRSSSVYWHYMTTDNAAIQANYQAHGSLWSIEVTLTVEWTT
jgi:hypothetical protein